MWEILSDHALPMGRDLAWHALQRIPALTPDAMFRVPVKELADAVGLAGPHREEKIERLRILVEGFRRHRDELDDAALRRGGLLGASRTLGMLSPVDRSARARATLFSVGFLVIPVDEDVSRVVNRLIADAAVTAGRPPVAHVYHGSRARRIARRWLADELPRDIDAYREAVLYLRHHGQHTCLAIGPHCAVCPLRADCPSAIAS